MKTLRNVLQGAIVAATVAALVVGVWVNLRLRAPGVVESLAGVAPVFGVAAVFLGLALCLVFVRLK